MLWKSTEELPEVPDESLVGQSRRKGQTRFPALEIASP